MYSLLIRTGQRHHSATCKNVLKNIKVNWFDSLKIIYLSLCLNSTGAGYSGGPDTSFASS